MTPLFLARSATSAPKTSRSTAPTCFDEIVLRKCAGCGRLTRALRAVMLWGRWRERCDDCAQRQMELLGLETSQERF